MAEKSSTEIERELAERRAKLDEDLSRLQERFTPGQVVDDAMSYLRRSGAGDHAGEFGRNLARSVRDNPIPVALIGVGLVWLMASGDRRRGHDYEADFDEHDPYRGGYPGVPATRSDVTVARGGETYAAGPVSASTDSTRGDPYLREGDESVERPLGAAGEAGGTRFAEFRGGAATGPYYVEGYRPEEDDDLEDLNHHATAAESALVREQGEDDDAWERRKLKARAQAYRLEDKAGETVDELKARIEAAQADAKNRYEAAKLRLSAWRADARRRGSSAYGRARGQASGAYGRARGGAERARYRAEGYGRRLQARGSSAYESVVDWFRDTAEAIEDGWESLTHSLDHHKRRAGESAADYSERMKQMTRDYQARARYYQERARLGLDDSYRRASHASRGATERAHHYFDRQPLLVGALGLAAGAVLASLVPMSRREQELMGPYRDELLDDAGDLAHEYRTRAERAGEAALQAARETAQEEGLTPSQAREGAKGAASDLASRVGHVADEAKRAAESEMRGAPDPIERAKEEASGSTTSSSTSAGTTGGFNR